MIGITILGFFAAGRAQADAFIGVRPLLLFALVLLVRRDSARVRWAVIAVATALVLAGEIILITRLGGSFDPRVFALQLALSLCLAGLLDLLVQGARRFGGITIVILALLLAIPLALGDPLGMAQRIAIGWMAPAPVALAKLPPLTVVTGLPVARGEGTIAEMLSGKAAPAQSWRWLETHFALKPIDFVTPQALQGKGLLLLAQPRLLQPQELVAIDDWARGGGRVLVLADPALRWKSLYPLGDARAPPAVSLLDPLLTRWGVRLDLRSAAARGYARHDLVVAGRRWQLAVDDAGAFVALDDRCTIEAQGLVARCAIGNGKAMLVADADLMADALWTRDGPGGAAPASRAADNGPLLGAWLDSLAGIARDRSAEAAHWIVVDAARGLALALAAIPGMLALLAGLFIAFLRSRRRR